MPSGEAVTANIVTNGEAKIVKAPPVVRQAWLRSGGLSAAALTPTSAAGPRLGGLS